MITSNPRFSSACFRNSHQYMLCADGEMIYIIVDRDLSFEVRSNASRDLIQYAEDWIQETVYDIATFCNADPNLVRDMLMNAIVR